MIHTPEYQDEPIASEDVTDMDSACSAPVGSDEPVEALPEEAMLTENTDEQATPEASDVPEKKSSSPLAFLLEYVELFVVCLSVILIVFSFFLRICSVSGVSMLPTLKNGQLLLVSDLFYDPRPGDIIVFHQTSASVSRFNEPIIKRIIATSGQHVRIDFTEGTIHIDGVLLEENYIQLVDTLGEEIGEYLGSAEHHIQMSPSPDSGPHLIFEATVPEGCLFVMGDNRNNSSDSRTAVIGFVDERRVLGRVICRLTPLESFGAVD